MWEEQAAAALIPTAALPFGAPTYKLAASPYPARRLETTEVKDYVASRSSEPA